MTAHAVLVDAGPVTDVVCEPCKHFQRFPRTAPAQDAVRAHNRQRHAYPEHELEIGDQP